MRERTVKVQYKNKYTMIVVRVSDDQGNEIHDYDLYILAGKKYSMDKLPKGFFVDRQKNRVNSCQLTYYLNSSKMSNILDNKIGFRIIARPTDGFAYYSPGEFRSKRFNASDLLKENETLMLDIVLKRHVDINTFKIDVLGIQEGDFKKQLPAGIDVQ